MKKLTNPKRLVRHCLAMGLALAIWTPIQSRSADLATGQMMREGKMMERCLGIMKQKQSLNEEIKIQDAELAVQVATMNSASNDKKLELVTSIVTHLTEQRAFMNARTGKFQEEMIKHLMQHMQMGTESISQCPLMTGMREIDENMAALPKKLPEAKK